MGSGRSLRRVRWAIVGVLLLVGGAVSAHHSYAMFDLEHPVTIEGRLVSFQYANPHSILMVRTDAEGVYTVTWQGIKLLQPAGIGASTLTAGDRLVITGAPYRDRAVLQVAVVSAIRRVSDGWTWSRR